MNQEQQIISPMVARRERKGMARYSVKNALGEQMAEQIVEGGGGVGSELEVGRRAGGGYTKFTYSLQIPSLKLEITVSEFPKCF